MNANDLLINGGPDGYVFMSRNGMGGWESPAGGSVAGQGGMFRVRVATTANGTLATAFDNASSVDGVTLATGDVILLKNQTTATENGVYSVIASGAPTRVAGFTTGATVHGYVVAVVEGTTNADSVWLCTNNTGSDVVDTDDLTFARLGSGGPGLLNVQVFTSSDTYTKTGGTTEAVVESQGSGGGGGGCDGSTGANTGGAAGGGGAGGYARKFISDMSAISTATITIGAAGSGGAAGNNNGTAGAACSYADGTNTITGNGGGLGTGDLAGVGDTSQAGGAGGTATGGDINITGGAGAAGRTVSESGRGVPLSLGDGGSSQLGQGGRSTINAAGGAATGYGAGGAGAATWDSSTDRAGADGSAGIVIVWEYGFSTTTVAPTSDVHIVQGRLTLTSGTPVTTSDVTAAGTLYFTPYNGNIVRLYDGSNWLLETFSEISLALSISDNTLYYIYLDDDAATLSTSTTAYTTQDGVRVKTGDTTKLFLGWLYASGANTAEDSEDHRGLINWYNQVERKLFTCPAYQDDNANDTYSFAAAGGTDWRAINGGTGDKVEFVSDGVHPVNWTGAIVCANSAASDAMRIGVGEESTTTATAQSFEQTTGSGDIASASVAGGKVFAEGYRHLNLLGAINSGDTVTVVADFSRLGGSKDPFATYLVAWVMG